MSSEDKDSCYWEKSHGCGTPVPEIIHEVIGKIDSLHCWLCTQTVQLPAIISNRTFWLCDALFVGEL
ncbi:MAG: hypothetical protein ABIP30_05165 [Ferruginibacter sp.]